MHWIVLPDPSLFPITESGYERKNTMHTFDPLPITSLKRCKKSTAPWQQDWDNAANVVPVSAVTEAPYRGTNALLLMAVRMSQGYGDNRWLTFRQVQELGGKVKRENTAPSASSGST